MSAHSLPHLQCKLINEYPDTQTALKYELIAVKNAITGLEAPLTTYAGQVQQTIGSTGSGASGLKNVLQSLVAAINSLLTDLGLGPIIATAVIGNAAGGPTGELLGSGTGLLSGGTGGLAAGAAGSLTDDLLGGSGFLGTGINLKRQPPGLSGLPISLPDLPTGSLPTGLISGILEQVEAVLQKLLGSTSLSIPSKRQIPGLSLPTGALPTSVTQEIIAEVEALLEQPLGATALPLSAKREYPDLPISIPTLPTGALPTSVIQQIIAEVESLLKELLGGATLPLPTKRQIPGLPITLPTGTDPTSIIQQILSEVEALLQKLLGSTALPKRTLPITLPTGTNPTDLIQQIIAELEALLKKLLGGAALPKLPVRQLPGLPDVSLVDDVVVEVEG